MNLVQYQDDKGNAVVAIVHSHDKLETLNHPVTLYDLAHEAITTRAALAAVAASRASGSYLDYQKLVDAGRLLPPLLHPDPAHTMVSGTGLTHLGSAQSRDAMHRKLQADEKSLTDSMRMFRLGLEGGKPQHGEPGIQPEWFYKGDGDMVIAPGADLAVPDFSLDIGDEAEIVGVYLIGEDHQAYRLGFALGNEYSDHKTERINYLYLAHSKLRQCAIGPELLLGELPADVKGTSRILRDGKLLWEKEFLSGENNMSHSITNLEYHHFKYNAFLRPRAVHIHFFGTGTLSVADGIETRPGDVFELESDLFGRPLRNTYRKETSNTDHNSPVIAL
jgi:hypothetical protein